MANEENLIIKISDMSDQSLFNVHPLVKLMKGDNSQMKGDISAEDGKPVTITTSNHNFLEIMEELTK